jgi:hypothetical protein
VLSRRGYRLTRFSDVLKAEVIARMPRTLRAAAKAEGFGEDVSLHELVHYLKPPVIRALLQEYGTEVRRADDPDYWVKAWAASLDSSEAVCVADVRFPNEAAYVRAREGIVLRVMRPGVGPLSDHASEVQDFLSDIIISNAGTLEDLCLSIEKLLVGLA